MRLRQKHFIKDFRRRRREYEHRVEAVVRAGVESGEFRDDLDPWLTSIAWLGLHNYTYMWFKPNRRLSAHNVATAFADLVLQGIAQPRGRSKAQLTEQSNRRRRLSPTQ